MKAYRDYARKHRPHIRVPEIVAPVTVHAAFDKAAGYFGMRLVKVPLAADFRVDMQAVRRAITANTVVLVGSAPGFPHGIVDPIEELAELAQSRGLGMHVDACLGGFLLPWLQRVGHPGLPNWNLSVQGVTSMSADTHKYGYAVKGTSVVLFADGELRKCMYFVYPEWVGGIYASPTISGSRAGGLLAACWASLVSLGQDGYLEAAKTISDAVLLVKAELVKIPQLALVGDSPTMVIAFQGSPAINAKDKNYIFKVMEGMKRRGWSLNPLQKPNRCVHCGARGVV
jgi:sphinganine-1-phosphate aldolase